MNYNCHQSTCINHHEGICILSLYEYEKCGCQKGSYYEPDNEKITVLEDEKEELERELIDAKIKIEKLEDALSVMEKENSSASSAE